VNNFPYSSFVLAIFAREHILTVAFDPKMETLEVASRSYKDCGSLTTVISEDVAQSHTAQWFVKE